MGRMTDTSDWTPVDEAGLLEGTVVSRLTSAGIEIDLTQVTELLLSDPSTATYLRAEAADGEPGFSQLVPRTRLFFNRPRAIDVGWDAVTLAAVAAVFQSLSLAGAATAMQRLLRAFRLLDDAEIDLVALLIGASGGRPYDRGVAEERIAAGYEDESAEQVRRRLAAMEKRGILVQAPDGWRLVR